MNFCVSLVPSGASAEDACRALPIPSHVLAAVIRPLTRLEVGPGMVERGAGLGPDERGEDEEEEHASRNVNARTSAARGVMGPPTAEPRGGSTTRRGVISRRRARSRRWIALR